MPLSLGINFTVRSSLLSMSSIPTSFLRAAILASTPALAVLIVSLKKFYS
jgi:hypothetical protein